MAHFFKKNTLIHGTLLCVDKPVIDVWRGKDD